MEAGVGWGYMNIEHKNGIDFEFLPVCSACRVTSPYIMLLKKHLILHTLTS